MMFEIMNLSYSVQGETVLKDITMSFPDRKVSALLGVSGSGKSTILKLLVGLLQPQQGRILFANEELQSLKIQEVSRRMGYMTQNGGLFPHLNLADNISLMARYLKWSPSAIRSRLDELLQMTQLESGLLSRFPQQVSGGQRQRASLARTLMLDPSVILLDEPLGALDPLTRYDLQVDLGDIFKRLGKLVVLVTHDLREAAQLADRIHVLHEGRIVQSGGFKELQATDDPFVQRFVRAYFRDHN